MPIFVTAMIGLYSAAAIYTEQFADVRCIVLTLRSNEHEK